MLGAARDNTLVEIANGSLSNGSGDYFFAGRTGQGAGSDRRRGLLAFDLSGIAPGSVINSVSLTLYMNQALSGPFGVSLHTVSQDWGEGASNASGEEGPGATASAGDATWTHTFSPSSTWTNPGGDFNAVASAIQSVGATTGLYIWTSAGMAADVQAWVDNPSSNFGWLLRGDESDTFTARRFASSENTTASFRPLLTIDFTAVPEPSRAILLLTAALTITLRRRRG